MCASASASPTDSSSESGWSYGPCPPGGKGSCSAGRSVATGRCPIGNMYARNSVTTLSRSVRGEPSGGCGCPAAGCGGTGDAGGAGGGGSGTGGNSGDTAYWPDAKPDGGVGSSSSPGSGRP